MRVLNGVTSLLSFPHITSITSHEGKSLTSGKYSENEFRKFHRCNMLPEKKCTNQADIDSLRSPLFLHQKPMPLE